MSTRTTQEIAASDDTVTVTRSDDTVLTFSYNAATQTYSVSGGGNSATFGPSQLLGYDSAGDAQYSQSTENSTNHLTLFNPLRMGGGTKYITAGLWQRRTRIDDDANAFTFDSFVYGYPTPTAGVPHTGSATYDIDLFAVASPIGNFPRSVVGDGTFSLDFAQGLFAMSGEATEYNNDADYWTCCSKWNGAGYLASNGGLTGRFTYAGRDRFNYRADIVGSLFGPQGSEVGGTLLGGDGDEATFTGIFAGTHARDGIEPILNVLGEGERSFYTIRDYSVFFQPAGENNSTGIYIPSSASKLIFGGDRSVNFLHDIDDARFEELAFTQRDLVTQGGDPRFTSYEKDTAEGNYQLSLYKPGAANPDVQLTYSSFGHWQEILTQNGGDRRTLSSWFTYGAPTAYLTTPTTGTANYSATVMGSGERYGDAERLTLTGASSIAIDFDAMWIEGTLDATARTSLGEQIVLPQLFFYSDFKGSDFDTFLFSAPGYAPGEIIGSLYGPNGEEIGGTFSYHQRLIENDPVYASYAGVFFGKRD